MAGEESEERIEKILEIALDMRQAKEVRIQAVRVLKLMGAVDELWAVAKNVRCPFTKRAAIDSIPALGVKVQDKSTISYSNTLGTKDDGETSTLPPIGGKKEAELPSVLLNDYLNSLSSAGIETGKQSSNAALRSSSAGTGTGIEEEKRKSSKSSRRLRLSSTQMEAKERKRRRKGRERERKIRLPSGIRGFDDLIGGGFPHGSLHILSGPYGGHHSTLVQQILYHHMISKGKVAYYVIEDSSQDIMDDMAVQKWNIERYVDDGSWKFIRLLPPSIEKIVELAEENPMEEEIPLKPSLVPLRDSLLAMLSERRWCVLNISYLMQNYSQSEIVELLLYMLAAMRRYGGAHFLLLTEGLLEEGVVNAVKSTVDGVFEFEDTGRAIEQGTTLNVRKMRKTVLSSRTIKITLMPSGIVAEK